MEKPTLPPTQITTCPFHLTYHQTLYLKETNMNTSSGLISDLNLMRTSRQNEHGLIVKKHSATSNLHPLLHHPPMDQNVDKNTHLHHILPLHHTVTTPKKMLLCLMRSRLMSLETTFNYLLVGMLRMATS